MFYERLLNAKSIKVGAKQTLKAIQKNEAKVVYLAMNAERHITEPIKQACLEKDIPVEMVETMKQLGKACGILVGCAAATLVEE